MRGPWAAHRGAHCLSGAHRPPVVAAYSVVMSDSKPFDRTAADVVLTALRRTRAGYARSLT